MTAPRKSPTLATFWPYAVALVILLAWHLAWLILAAAVLYVAGDRHGRRRQARGLAKWVGRRG